MKLIIFRHGLTSANERRLYCGGTDLPLSDRGREDLRRLRASNALPPLEGMEIITSPARRCLETLWELYGPFPHRTDPDLREMDFGDFEMKGYGELKTDPAYLAWITGDNDSNVCPHGESGAQMRSRVLRALRRVLRTNRPTALFTHGGPIAAIMGELFPSEQKNLYQWQPAPGGGYEVDTNEPAYKPL